MLNILIVDDEQILRFYLEGIVNWEEHECQIVATCRSESEALQLFKTMPIDLVLMDLKIAKMNGLQLIEEMKAHHLDIPVIVLSNYSDYDLVRQALKLGAMDYLVKINLQVKDLLHSIEQVKLEMNEKQLKKRSLREEERKAIDEFKVGRKSFLETVLKGEVYYSEFELEQYANLYHLFEHQLSLYSLGVKENSKIEQEQFAYLAAIIGEQFSELEFDIIYPNQENVLIILYEHEHLEQPFIMDRWLKITRYLHQHLNLDLQVSKGLLIDSIKKLIPFTRLSKEAPQNDEINPIISDKELERYRSEIQLVLHYIHEHYVNHITLHDLAAHVCLNESYLSRLFKIETKKTLNRYLNEIRIYKAKQLLKQSDIRVKEVAQLVGIKDQLYFNRVFKKFSGENPTEYQERVKKLISK